MNITNFVGGMVTLVKTKLEELGRLIVNASALPMPRVEVVARLADMPKWMSANEVPGAICWFEERKIELPKVLAEGDETTLKNLLTHELVHLYDTFAHHELSVGGFATRSRVLDFLPTQVVRQYTGGSATVVPLFFDYLASPLEALAYTVDQELSPGDKPCAIRNMVKPVWGGPMPWSEHIVDYGNGQYTVVSPVIKGWLLGVPVQMGDLQSLLDGQDPAKWISREEDGWWVRGVKKPVGVPGIGYSRDDVQALFERVALTLKYTPR